MRSNDPTRGEVVRAAVALIDQNGLRGLTSRKISSHLGVQTRALARLFHDREELLDGIVEAVVDELYADPDVRPISCHWQEYLQTVAHGVCRAALAHPAVFPLIATRSPAAPWLHPPLRSLRWMETFLESLHQCGFSDRAAATAYRAFSSFLLGHLLLEVAALGDIGSVGRPERRPVQPSDLADYPRMAAMADELAQNHADQQFEEALETLLDRLEGQGIQ